jgi:hypothetical protein
MLEDRWHCPNHVVMPRATQLAGPADAALRRDPQRGIEAARAAGGGHRRVLPVEPRSTPRLEGQR